MPTKLYSTNVDVDRINDIELDKLAEKDVTFYEYEMDTHINAKVSNRAGVLEKFKKSCNAPEILQLCVGAQVMLLKNLDLFITVSNSTAHFAGALGVPTILICPKKSSTYYYWNTQTGSSIWYKNIKVLGIKKSINETVNVINNILEKGNEFKFSN